MRDGSDDADLTGGEDAFDPASDDPAQWPVGRLLSAAARRVEREWNTHLGGWDLNHASLPVLVHLARAPRSQRELAALCGVTEQTMSRVLARMERTGYVRRAPHEEDRRRHVISATPEGLAALGAAADPRRAEEVVTRGLTAAQVEQLRALLVLVARPDHVRGASATDTDGAGRG
ncbi:MarR family transcriptional regulator [Cellulomonas fimi]|uniref:MarR family winged helix-turn-helix transcriptional regulator n=1 Tax=Cellulomonas fimi TaxID=1708 RepID=UPI00234D9D28|nr:MarR family transcriptional regulator [Cellulomonas fimi]MDC7122497.1 MarR family transcriptional regulator [Cellulomonas fimi]